MEYEKIILEMLSRIQALEEQVRELQEAEQVRPPFRPHFEKGPHSFERPLPPHHPRRPHMKVTEEMLLACYHAGKEVYHNDNVEAGKLADQVSVETGMNRNNALMTIFAVVALLNGELYKRAISGKGTEYYFDLILNDYGHAGLQKAIAAMRLHIDYRRSLNHNVDLLEIICDRYQKKI